MERVHPKLTIAYRACCDFVVDVEDGDETAHKVVCYVCRQSDCLVLTIGVGVHTAARVSSDCLHALGLDKSDESRRNRAVTW